jgi:hypothetical protein
VIITLTPDQALYVQELLGVESAKNNCAMMLAITSLPAITDTSTEDEKKAREIVLKPYTDREAALYLIEQAFTAKP